MMEILANKIQTAPLRTVPMGSACSVPQSRGWSAMGSIAQPIVIVLLNIVLVGSAI